MKLAREKTQQQTEIQILQSCNLQPWKIQIQAHLISSHPIIWWSIFPRLQDYRLATSYKLQGTNRKATTTTASTNTIAKTRTMQTLQMDENATRHSTALPPAACRCCLSLLPEGIEWLKNAKAGQGLKTPKKNIKNKIGRHLNPMTSHCETACYTTTTDWNEAWWIFIVKVVL